MYQGVTDLIGFAAIPEEAPAGVSSIDSVDYTTSSVGANITAPAVINAGDLLVLLDTPWSYAVPDKVIPAGFTEVFSDGAYYVRGSASYKIAEGTEDSSTITGQVGGYNFDDKCLLRFVPNVPITSVTVGSVHHEITFGDPAQQSCTASGAAAPLIIIAIYGDLEEIVSQVFNPAQDAEIAMPSGFTAYRYKVYNASPSDTIIDQGESGNNAILASFYLKVA
jgi:hypothetical protein